MAYEKQTWANGDIITAEKLNHMESGIAKTNKSVTFDLQASIIFDKIDEYTWVPNTISLIGKSFADIKTNLLNNVPVVVLSNYKVLEDNVVILAMSSIYPITYDSDLDPDVEGITFGNDVESFRIYTNGTASVSATPATWTYDSDTKTYTFELTGGGGGGGEGTL